MENKKIAKKIIEDSIYLTLGTAKRDKPWIAPLYYCVGEKFELYFISKVSSLHVRHILKNPVVAFSIYDSHQKEGTGNGMQGIGECTLLKSDTEIEKSLKYYHTDFLQLTKENLQNGDYRMFKIVPQHIYIQNPESSADERIEVKL